MWIVIFLFLFFFFPLFRSVWPLRTFTPFSGNGLYKFYKNNISSPPTHTTVPIRRKTPTSDRKYIHKFIYVVFLVRSLVLPMQFVFTNCLCYLSFYLLFNFEFSGKGIKESRYKDCNSPDRVIFRERR